MKELKVCNDKENLRALATYTKELAEKVDSVRSRLTSRLDANAFDPVTKRMLEETINEICAFADTLKNFSDTVDIGVSQRLAVMEKYESIVGKL